MPSKRLLVLTPLAGLIGLGTFLAPGARACTTSTLPSCAVQDVKGEVASAEQTAGQAVATAKRAPGVVCNGTPGAVVYTGQNGIYGVDCNRGLTSDNGANASVTVIPSGGVVGVGGGYVPYDQDPADYPTGAWGVVYAGKGGVSYGYCVGYWVVLPYSCG